MGSLAVQLAAFLGQHHAPFSWHGETCAHWVARWIEAATGRDALHGLRACSDLRDWLRAVGAAGSVESLVTRQLRCSAIHPAMAQLGDIVLVPGAISGGILGLCAGATVALRGDDGASVHLPMAEAQAAWRLREVAA